MNTHPTPIRGASAPEAEGVYLISDQTGEVVYIGRSGNLRKRIQGHAAGDVLNSAVAQHIYDGQPFHADYPRMSAWVRERLEDYSVAWVVTNDSHTVERQLIAENEPRWNRDQ